MIKHIFLLLFITISGKLFAQNYDKLVNDDDIIGKKYFLQSNFNPITETLKNSFYCYLGLSNSWWNINNDKGHWFIATNLEDQVGLKSGCSYYSYGVILVGHNGWIKPNDKYYKDRNINEIYINSLSPGLEYDFLTLFDRATFSVGIIKYNLDAYYYNRKDKTQKDLGSDTVNSYAVEFESKFIVGRHVYFSIYYEKMLRNDLIVTDIINFSIGVYSKFLE